MAAGHGRAPAENGRAAFGIVRAGGGYRRIRGDRLGDPVSHEETHAERDDHVSARSPGPPLTRRAALQLAAGAGAVVATAPYLARVGDRRGLVDVSSAELVSAPDLDWPVPPIVTRAKWGANESLRRGDPEFNSAIGKLIVHHTGTPNDITDYAGLARGILMNEVNNGYIDIAYNWLIDPHGRIYEGRWAQDYPAGIAHTGERDRLNVQGAHALHFNVDTIGIGLMGDYSDVAPTPAMVEALVTLMTWKCARWGLDPVGAAPFVNSEGARVTHLANICGHRDTYATACPGDTVEAMLPLLRSEVGARLAVGSTGYWIASSAGQLLAFGNLPNAGGATAHASRTPILGLSARPTGRGYWLFGSDGGVFCFGDAKFFGSTGAQHLNEPIVGMAPTPTGRGYWLVGRDGGVFCFGDARFLGSTGGLRLNAPVLGLTPTSTGKGYWLFARDGGVFCFGDAKFFGSTGGIRLNQPIVGMAARPQNDGYWIVAADGGVFCFGHAPFLGSGVSHFRSAPCVSLTASTTGKGYVLLFADGAVFTFGDAPFFGSAVGRLFGPAVGLAGRVAPLV